MTKLQPRKSALSTPDQVSDALRQIKEISIEIDQIQADLNSSITDVTAVAEAQVAPLIAEKAALEKDIEAYIQEHTDLFTSVRKKVTLFGHYGLQKIKPFVELLGKTKPGDVVSQIRTRIGTIRKSLAKADEVQAEKLIDEKNILDRFIEVKYSLSKEAILAAHRTGDITN